MKFVKISIAALVGAASIATASYALQPMEGSITYKNPEAVRFTKAPAGTTLNHEFYAGGNKYRETYVINDNGSVTLTSRTTGSSD
jgi:hypothetical protein